MVPHKNNDTERAKEELRKGRDESAATTAAESSTSMNQSRKSLKVSLKSIVLLLLLLVVVIGGVMFATFGQAPKKETAVFIEQVKELSTLATVETSTKVVIQGEDNQIFGKEIDWNVPGTKRKFLIVVPGEVLAGVDLQQVSEEDVSFDDETNTLSLVLPRAQLLQDPSIDMDNVIAYSEDGLFRDEIDWNEGFDLMGEAKKLISKEVLEAGILETAEQNAEKALQEFFGHLDYEVNISFK